MVHELNMLNLDLYFGDIYENRIINSKWNKEIGLNFFKIDYFW